MVWPRTLFPHMSAIIHWGECGMAFQRRKRGKYLECIYFNILIISLCILFVLLKFLINSPLVLLLALPSPEHTKATAEGRCIRWSAAERKSTASLFAPATGKINCTAWSIIIIMICIIKCSNSASFLFVLFYYCGFTAFIDLFSACHGME